jgi:hypothetical protein
MQLTKREIRKYLEELQSAQTKIQTLLKKLYSPKEYDIDPRILNREAAENFWSQKVNGHFHVYISFNLNWLKETIQERHSQFLHLISPEHHEILILYHLLRSGSVPDWLQLSTEQCEIVKAIKLSLSAPEREINEPIYTQNNHLVINGIHDITHYARRLNEIAVMQFMLNALLQLESEPPSPIARPPNLLDLPPRNWIQIGVSSFQSTCDMLELDVKRYREKIYYRAFETVPPYLWPKVKVEKLVDDIYSFILNKQTETFEKLVQNNTRFKQLERQASERANRLFHQFDENTGFHDQPFALSSLSNFVFFGPISDYFKRRANRNMTSTESRWLDIGFFLKINDTTRFLTHYKHIFVRFIKNEPDDYSGNWKKFHHMGTYLHRMFDLTVKSLLLPLMISLPIIGLATLPFKIIKEWLRERSRLETIRKISMVLCDLMAASIETLALLTLGWSVYATCLSYQLALMPLVQLTVAPFQLSIASILSGFVNVLHNGAAVAINRIGLYVSALISIHTGYFAAKLLSDFLPKQRISSYFSGFTNSRLMQLGRAGYNIIENLCKKMKPRPYANEIEAYTYVPLPDIIERPYGRYATIHTRINDEEGKTFFRKYPLTNRAQVLDVANTFTESYKALYAHGRAVEIEYISEQEFRLSFRAP